ncbi:MAG: helix-turn-helix transcriptional regulator [Flavisolibacter sp.]|nr:helix-turn-helix transcriptional regulator [Flavisolibacter sp.]
MKVKREAIQPDTDSSFRILLTPNLNDLFYWHFHPEYEIVYVEANSGVRHIGDHISRYKESDLVFIGPNIPHLNFDYGVRTSCEQVVVQMKEDFLGKEFLSLPELATVRELFERAQNAAVAFYGDTKKQVSERLKSLTGLSHFRQLIELLHIFQLLATSEEYELIQSRPVAHASLLKEQQRLQQIYQYIELHYQEVIDVKEVAAQTHLTPAAFCRYFKKATHLTFTDFLNQYRINQAKKLLLHDKNVTEACYESGFENLSYFTKTFKKITGENPSGFKRKHLASQ